MLISEIACPEKQNESLYPAPRYFLVGFHMTCRKGKTHSMSHKMGIIIIIRIRVNFHGH